jgi:hypothetical protein
MVLTLGRRILISGALVASLAAGVGCGDPPPGCRAACEDLKTELEENYSCSIDCTAPPWSDAPTCSACLEAFDAVCKVRLLDGCFCHKYYGEFCEGQ